MSFADDHRFQSAIYSSNPAPAASRFTNCNNQTQVQTDTMKRSPRESVTVELQNGGILEYEKSGIYPEYLIVISEKLDCRWRKSISADEKEGVLNMNRKPKYRYRVEEGELTITEMDGTPVEISATILSMHD